MQTPDINPFLIRGYKDKEHFCDREAETKNLLHLLSSRQMSLLRYCIYDLFLQRWLEYRWFSTD